MDPKTVLADLAAPFEVNEVKWKPQAVKNNRALAIGYVDARVIQDRLDDVLGVENWQDDYQMLPDGSVVCKLSIRVGADWISKMDVGSPSEQPDGGDRLKAAFSDALKRAAIKFGVGRYLYRLPSQWCDYDPVKKQFSKLPQLPDWARPKSTTQTLRQQPPHRAEVGGARPPDRAEVDKPDPVELYYELERDLRAAVDEKGLKVVFGRVYKASEAGHIGKDAYKALEKVKDEIKAKFAQPAK